jgi:predicted nucleic acid-binding protein
VIYLDTSVALAHLLAEDRRPPASLWGEPIITSRILEYEVWNRIHGRGLGTSHRASVEALLGRLAWVELVRPVLTRAADPFPAPVRTLDALHLASMDFLLRQGQRIRLASYDERLNAAARKGGIDLYPLQ